MKIYTSNINNINGDIESFVIAKNKIERDLIEKEKINEKMTVKEFIEFMTGPSNSIFIDNTNKLNNVAILFNIYELSNKDLVIVYSAEEESNNFINSLKTINYNLKNLKKVSQLDLLNFNETQYFLINGEIYVM